MTVDLSSKEFAASIGAWAHGAHGRKLVAMMVKHEILIRIQQKGVTLPETVDDWKTTLLLGFGPFSGAILVLGRVSCGRTSLRFP